MPGTREKGSGLNRRADCDSPKPRFSKVLVSGWKPGALSWLPLRMLPRKRQRSEAFSFLTGRVRILLYGLPFGTLWSTQARRGRMERHSRSCLSPPLGERLVNFAESESCLLIARQALQELGYTDPLVRQDYTFADILDPHEVDRHIALAAFGQEPPSYRTSCIGVVLVDGQMLNEVARYRALGAPQIFALNAGVVGRWKMTAQGDPLLLESFPTDSLLGVMRKHKSDWGPEEILRAKSIALDMTPVQLDFFDAGLLPVIEIEAQRKLDLLLRNTIAATLASFSENDLRQPDYRILFRLVFRLLAAKVLADRKYPGTWIADDPSQVIEAVERFYFRDVSSLSALTPLAAQDVAWRWIRSGFNFQNISVDTLAHVYENTLVSSEARRCQSIYCTPPQIADYAVRRLPFELLPVEERRVFEPFAGQSVFLISALGRLRELLGSVPTVSQRHNYLVRMLAGMEKDSFAVEVARLSLMLADYPSPDGWRLLEDDVFSSNQLAQELHAARVVMCNPPFEEFDREERSVYSGLRSTNKSAEILLRVLDCPPSLLAFVLPRRFIDGRSFRETRRRIAESYADVEVIALPDVAFSYSEAETVLLLAHGLNTGKVSLRAVTVGKRDYAGFLRGGQPTSEAHETLGTPEIAHGPALWLYPLRRVWAELENRPCLKTLAETHRGIEYRGSLKDSGSQFISNVPRAGFTQGIARVSEQFEPYSISSHVYLNMSPHVMKGNAYLLPWSQPKIIANAARSSRGPWTIMAAPDYNGLVCYQRFHGIWPTGGISLELLAAILNGPVANAFISVRRTARDNRVSVIGDVPVPCFSDREAETIAELVREYRKWRLQWTDDFAVGQAARQCRYLLLEIDAAVLSSYGLSPRLERDLLRHFEGSRRPVLFEFTSFYPEGFGPAVPLRFLISHEYEAASARETLRRLPVLADTLISDAMAGITEDS